MNHQEHPVSVNLQKVPARTFVGLRMDGSRDYGSFWDRAHAVGWTCEAVDAALAALGPSAPIGGWLAGDPASYLYGVELPADWAAAAPKGFTVMRIPETEYAVFHHGPYDFGAEEAAVGAALERALAEWKPETRGREVITGLPVWQRHDPAGVGQARCVPVRART